MNPAERLVRAVDRAQQRHKTFAFSYGVLKKYGDDSGGQLAASLAHAAFVSLFPLLLVLVTILGLLAAGNPALRHEVLSSVTTQFPIMGDELGRNVKELHRSSLIGLIIGLLVLLWGASALAQTGMFAMAQIWNVPGPQRPGYLQRLGRTGLFFIVLAIAVLATTGLASFSTFSKQSPALVIAADAIALVVNMAMYLLGFRVLTPKRIATRDLVLGAMLAGFAWTVLQAVGTLIVKHYLHSASVYGIFAIVLAMLAWIYLVVQVTVYAAEVNVVRARKLYPRSIAPPPLTDADRAALALQPLQNQRREEQHIEVTFLSRAPGKPAPSGTS